MVVSNIFYFHPYLGKGSNLTCAYFSNGLVKNHQLEKPMVLKREKKQAMVIKVDGLKSQGPKIVDRSKSTCAIGEKSSPMTFPYNRGWEKSTQFRRGLYTNYKDSY